MSSDYFSALDTDDLDEQKPQKPRITLKLPSLKALKSKKPAKPPRPVKLKPLKEVLAKLIAQIKKKDVYAFFLEPVDAAQVPGYANIVKQPMDFGTMTAKVGKSKYKTLDDFAADIRLVTGNAKAFNPPGTIYYTEAERIEQYALDIVDKSVGTVIQHEVDWNIDVEDEDAEPVPNVQEDDGDAMDVDEPGPSHRAGSVVSATEASSSRRRARGPYKKQQPTEPKSEVADTGGHLPGYKEGLCAFPATSDLSRTMLALKQKGKKYKTKKERLRFEKEGPPLHPDGSLDYWEVEEPFSIMSALVPDPMSRPLVTSLHPPPPLDSSSPEANPSFLGPVALSSNASIPAVPPDKKHWHVHRNFTTRGHKKEDDKPPPVLEREVHTFDWGSAAHLAAELAEEMRRRGISAVPESEPPIVRQQLDPEENAKKKLSDEEKECYWNTRRAASGEAYLHDLVYGGVDGFAYARSLAEFVKPMGKRFTPDAELELGMPLAKYVEKTVLDPLTEDNHRLLRQAAELLQDPSTGDERPWLRQQIYHASVIHPLMALNSEKVDLPSLVYEDSELRESEEVWEGRKFGKDALRAVETPAETREVMEFVEKRLKELVEKPMKGRLPDGQADSPEMRRLRLNLLALGKRVKYDLLQKAPKGHPAYARLAAVGLGA